MANAFRIMISALALSFALAAVASIAAPPNEDAAHRDAFLNHKYRLVWSNKALPIYIVNEIGTLANPGEDWNFTDVIYDDLPRRQLVVAGIGETSIFVLYRQGGRGLSNKLAIFLEGKEGTFRVCAYYTEFGVDNYLSIRRRFKSRTWNDKGYYQDGPSLTDCHITR